MMTLLPHTFLHTSPHNKAYKKAHERKFPPFIPHMALKMQGQYTYVYPVYHNLIASDMVPTCRMETTINHHHNHRKNNKKLSRVLSTKLSIEDYNAFLTLTKLEYEAGLIKEQSPSELLRFTICRLLVQLRNNRIYHYQKKNSNTNHVNLVHSLSLLELISIKFRTYFKERTQFIRKRASM